MADLSFHTLVDDQNLKATTTIEFKNSYMSQSSESRSHIIYEDEGKHCDQRSERFSSSPFVVDTDTENISLGKSRSPRKDGHPRRPSSRIQQVQPLTENALRENEGLAAIIGAAEHKRTQSRRSSDISNEAMSMMADRQGYAGADDTSLSAFSAVPNTDMALLAPIGQSPMISVASSPTRSSRKLNYRRDASKHRYSSPDPPANIRRRDIEMSSPCSSPTPRRPGYIDSGDTTNLIIDFTEQFNTLAPHSQPSPSRTTRSSPFKSNTQPDLAAYASELRHPSAQPPKTPAEARQLTSLLDFDLTPAPTPRSAPTISVRELESLKSSFLSQISSLRATINGKEAEINSLKEAVEDAERRVGEALEQVRVQRDAKEELEAHKDEWERRDKEIQTAVEIAKEELMHGDQEREELKIKADDAERRREEAEARAAQAESKVAGMEAGSAASGIGEDASTPGSNSNKAVEVAVEKVARELHTLYKAKHETKVVALKKSYENRWEKKIKELETKVDEVGKENKELKNGRDATYFRTTQALAIENDDGKPKQDPMVNMKRLEEQDAEVVILAEKLENVRQDNERLRSDLELERMERGELVIAVEEMLLIQATAPSVEGPTHSALENPRGSVSRASGLKGPGFGSSVANGESRIGMMQLKHRSTSGLAGARSGIMSNIERMGRGRIAD
ncbi:hypothetical protein MMC06_005274 [Schaereria dolodes]|nr:hypothetical protein [Schaereria dolodes]